MTGTSLSMKSLPHHPTKITPFPRFLSLKKKTLAHYRLLHKQIHSLSLALALDFSPNQITQIPLSLSLSNFLSLTF